MMTTDSPVISADSHIQEPPELYEQWLSKKYRHRTPHTTTDSEGAVYRVIDGKRPRRIDIAESRVTEDDQTREFRSDPSGGRDIGKRLLDQERDNICAEVIYPNQSLFLYNSPDAGYQLALAKAYNTWLWELVASNKERFAPVAIIPVADLDGAVAEAHRVAKLGYRSIKIPITMADRPYNDPAYNPFWATCEDAGLVVSFHAFTNSDDRYPEDWGEENGTGGALNLMAMSMIDGMNPVSLLISSGTLMRHPDLKFVVVECGAGWLAWLLYMLDEQYGKKHMWIQPRLDLQPSEYFQRQGYVTFSDDPVALQCLSFTGAGSLLWGSDYPHDEGTFPNSQAVIERTFANITPKEKRQIVYDNAARLYGFNT